MFRTFIQFTVLFLTFIASFFWIRGSLILSSKDIACLAGAGATWQYNPATLNNLTSQKADSLIAGLLLLVSFLLQVCNSYKPTVVFGIDKRGVAVSVILSLAIFIGCHLGSSCLAKYYTSQAKTQIFLIEKTK